MTDRRVDAEGFWNARDLGGLPRVAGGVTPSGVFLRAENPDLLTTAGWERLRDLGVRTLVDLRRDDERALDRRRRPDWMAVREVDFRDPDFVRRVDDDELVGSALHYGGFVREARAPILRALTAVADAPPGAVLVHCMGGRDRTGLVSALLLKIAGVRDEAIVADYVESIGNAPALAAAQRLPNWEPGLARLLEAHGTTSERAFRDFIEHLDVAPLLAALPADRATALRTWRGALA